MNTEPHAATADHHHDDHAHGSLSTYLLGFVLSVALTLQTDMASTMPAARAKAT